MENYLNYIDKFATETDVQTAVDNGQLLKPYVAYIEDEDKIDWNSKKIDYSSKYLTFEMITDGELVCNCNTRNVDYPFSIEYKINNGDWETLTLFSATTEYSISNNLKIGDKISFKGNREKYGYDVNSGFKIYGKELELYNVYGNIMSMIYGDNFIGQTLLPNNNYIFSRFFSSANTYGNKKFGVVSAENLILPATTLKNYCYQLMFYGCTALVSAPSILPATTLANYCYDAMFQGCISLTTAPELPATTLAYNCYSSMFGGCTSLTTAPALPATTLVTNCYKGMFYGCSGLTTAPVLSATTLAVCCYYNMFRNCTSLTTAPALQATTLAAECYYNMFNGCGNLNYIKCLATDISASNCTNGWVSGVASTGTFVKAAGSTWSTGTSGIPSGWTVQEV